MVDIFFKFHFGCSVSAHHFLTSQPQIKPPKRFYRRLPPISKLHFAPPHTCLTMLLDATWAWVKNVNPKFARLLDSKIDGLTVAYRGSKHVSHCLDQTSRSCSRASSEISGRTRAVTCDVLQTCLLALWKKCIHRLATSIQLYTANSDGQTDDKSDKHLH